MPFVDLHLPKVDLNIKFLVYVKIWRTYKAHYLVDDFYTDWNESSIAMHPVIRDVAALW
jgi:hypothetical protein